LIRPWGCKTAFRKRYMQRSAGGCGSGAGTVRRELRSANAGA